MRPDVDGDTVSDKKKVTLEQMRALVEDELGEPVDDASWGELVKVLIAAAPYQGLDLDVRSSHPLDRAIRRDHSRCGTDPCSDCR